MQNTLQVQDLVLSSRALEDRGVQHPPAVTKAVFTQNYKSTQSFSQARRYCSWKHRMPETWTTILGKKCWRTVSEETTRRSVAAWEWLQNGHPAALAAAQGLGSALFSRLVVPYTLLRCRSTADIKLCLGHASWAVLSWPTEILDTNIDGMVMCVVRAAPGDSQTQHGPSAPRAQFFHITDVSQWDEIPYEVAVVEHGIAMKQVKPPQPLLTAALLRPQKLSNDDLKRLCRFFGLASGASRAKLLEALATNVAGGDEEFVRQVLERDKRPSRRKATANLADDPLFEHCYEEMDVEDKEEFPEVRDAIKKKRVRRHVVQVRVRRATQKRVKQKARAKQQVARHRRGLAPPASGGQVGAVAPIEPPSGPAALLPPPPPPAPVQPASEDRIERAQPMVPRAPRAETWAQGRFTLARHVANGQFRAWTVTCRLHTADSQRCNKSLSIGSMPQDEAKRRIQEWCLKGVEVPDDPGGRFVHMAFEPRDLTPRSAEELQAVASALGPA